MLSIREKIIQAIQDRLTDGVGVACLRVPRVQRDYEDDVLIGLIDGDGVRERLDYDVDTWTMRLTVEYMRRREEPDFENESVVANEMIAEMTVLLDGIDPTLGGLCLKIVPAVVRPIYNASILSDYSAAAADIDITYQTDRGDPYIDSNPH